MGREHLETGGADAPSDDRNMGKAVTGLESNPVTAHEINNNNVPELVVESPNNSHAQGCYALYTYDKGKVVCIGSMMDDIHVYSKKSMVEAIHGGTGGYERYYLIISDKKVKHYLHKVSEKESDYDLNGDGKISGAVYSKFKSSDGSEREKISKKKFNSLLKKKVGKTKLKSVKFYKNTKKNRKKILK